MILKSIANKKPLRTNQQGLSINSSASGCTPTAELTVEAQPSRRISKIIHETPSVQQHLQTASIPFEDNSGYGLLMQGHWLSNFETEDKANLRWQDLGKALKSRQTAGLVHLFPKTDQTKPTRVRVPRRERQLLKKCFAYLRAILQLGIYIRPTTGLMTLMGERNE